MYKIKCLLVSCFVLLAVASFSQTEIKVLGSSPDLYLSHTIAAKETWFSLGRTYNLKPADIAAYNKTNVTEVLKLGQVLKIPLTANNFSQDGQRAADEVFVPVYYTVQPKEWMYRISQGHNKVPIATLEGWNNVKNDDLKAGMNLIVGYLKVRTGQSAFAAKGSKKIVTQTAAAAVAKTDKPVAEPLKKPEEKKPEVVAVTESKPVSPTVTPRVTPPVTQTQTPTQPTPVVTNTSSIPTETWDGYKGGYFKKTYAEKGSGTTGNAGIFRSTSGWKDGKYYALINDVPVGTIVKITFPTTNKSVYAKVLGQLPEMKESMGLKLRLSDAAAAELGADVGKFYVDVKY